MAMVKRNLKNKPIKATPKPAMMVERVIRLPYNFAPRDYQIPVYEALDRGIKRAVMVWHRRAGKDLTALNYAVKSAYQRVGIYYHFLPTYSQGKKIVWDGMDREGRRFLDYIPKEIISNKNDSEMKLRLKNGSIYQVVGVDNIDSIVGTNPIGCIFSEYSLQNPQAWSLVRPILLENGGWALFCYTPRGKNHGFQLYEMARKNPKTWYCSRLAITDTFREDGRPVFLASDVEQEVAQGMDADLAQQEYYVSFEGPLQGSYYGKQLNATEKEGRIGNVPWEPNVQVDTWWDLGIGDAMAIWFTQSVHNEIRVIDYLEASGEGLQYYAKELRAKDYVYGRHGFPHDAEVRELGTGKSRKEVAESLGIKPIDIVPKLPVEDGIGAVRAILARCWFDAKKCDQGLNALRSYTKEWDEKAKCWKDRPAHDWSSHGADSFRYFAVGHREKRSMERPQTQAIMDFEPLTYTTQEPRVEVVSEWNAF